MFSRDHYLRISRFHEAAHCVMAYNLGMQIDWVKMHYIEGDQEICAVQYVGATSPYATSVEKLHAMVVLVALAGQYGSALAEGQELTGKYYRRYGASDDVRVAREHGGRYWRDWIADVNYFMNRYKGQVTALAGLIGHKDYVSGEDVERLLDSVPSNQ